MSRNRLLLLEDQRRKANPATKPSKTTKPQVSVKPAICSAITFPPAEELGVAEPDEPKKPVESAPNELAVALPPAVAEAVFMVVALDVALILGGLCAPHGCAE